MGLEFIGNPLEEEYDSDGLDFDLIDTNQIPEQEELELWGAADDEFPENQVFGDDDDRDTDPDYNIDNDVDIGDNDDNFDSDDYSEDEYDYVTYPLSPTLEADKSTMEHASVTDTDSD